MKAHIRYSWIYSKILAPKLEPQEFKKFVEKSKPFKKKVEKLLPKITKIIEENNKGKWKYKFIPIYFVPENNICFSDPLTLVYRFHDGYSLVALCHELLHNHLTEKFKNPKELHEFMEPINNKIVKILEKEIKINLSENLDKFNKKTMERYRT